LGLSLKRSQFLLFCSEFILFFKNEKYNLSLKIRVLKIGKKQSVYSKDAILLSARVGLYKILSKTFFLKEQSFGDVYYQY